MTTLAVFLAKRLAQSVLVVAAAALLVFVLIRLSGDPVALLLPPEASPQLVADVRHRLGLDQPIWVQFGVFVSQAAHGDFGVSYRNNQPAMQLVLDRVPATIELAAVAFLFTLVVALPSGILSALRPNGAIDAVSRALVVLGQGIPSFWLGIMLILIFAVRLRWFPPFGTGGPEYLVLPAVSLGAYFAAITSRLLRSALLDVLSADYIRTARAKGLRGSTVVMRHALRNASLPVVTMLGLQIGALLGGAVVTEYVFAYPGVGRLVLDAIAHRDYAVVQAFVILIAIVVAIVNILVDIAYAVLDPRVRLT